MIPKDIQPYEEYSEEKNENATNKIQQQSSSQMLSTSPLPLPRHLSTSSKSSASTAAAKCFGANKENINRKRSTSSIGDDDLFVKRGKKAVIEIRYYGRSSCCYQKIIK